MAGVFWGELRSRLAQGHGRDHGSAGAARAAHGGFAGAMLWCEESGALPGLSQGLQ